MRNSRNSPRPGRPAPLRRGTAERHLRQRHFLSTTGSHGQRQPERHNQRQENQCHMEAPANPAPTPPTHIVFPRLFPISQEQEQQLRSGSQHHKGAACSPQVEQQQEQTRNRSQQARKRGTPRYLDYVSQRRSTPRRLSCRPDVSRWVPINPVQYGKPKRKRARSRSLRANRPLPGA